MDEIAKLAQELVRFRSTSDHPEQMRACLDFCANYFSGEKVHIKRFESNGIPSLVISNTDSREFDVILLGHIDTVDGDKSLFEGRIEDGKLFGRGTMDMKAFVASSMYVAKELLARSFSGTFALMIVTDEETGGFDGARYLVEEEGYRADTVLVPDDGNRIENIVQETKHILHLRFRARGKEAHANRPWNGQNAIDKLIESYLALRSHFGDMQTEPEDIWINTINLGTISGGVATNEVPEHAQMDIDIRFVDGTTKEEVLSWVRSSLVDGVDFEILLEGYPTKLDPHDERVIAYARAIEKHIGAPARFVKSGGGTDARFFAEAGMRTIVHQGNGGNVQAHDEYVELSSLRTLADIQLDFICKQYG